MKKPSHPKFAYKLLRRSIVIDQNNPNLLKKVRIKELYLKRIIITAYYQNNYLNNLKEQRYIKNKLFKTLFHANLTTFTKLYWLKALRSVKKLAIFTQPFSFAGTRYCLEYLKKLPPKIQILELCQQKEDEWKKKDLKPIYRTVASFKELQVFKRYFSSDSHREAENIEFELLLMNRYLSRLTKLELLENNLTLHDQRSLHKALKKNIGSKLVTNLLLITSFHSDNQLAEGLMPERNDFGSLIMLNEGDKLIPSEDMDPKQRQLLQEEIMPFYRYELFPSLKILTLIITDECLYPLGDFVYQGFAALTQLRSLSLNFHTRPPGSAYLLEALLYLPLIISFSIEIPFVKNQEWEIFDRFFRKQNELISLSFVISMLRILHEEYFQQTKHVENFWTYLENKPNFRYLRLRSPSWTLDTLSSIFAKVNMTNQLKFLDIEGIDDCFTPETSKAKADRIQGIADFIKRQKDSLYYLRIDLPLVFDNYVIDSIGEALSYPENLRELELNINSSEYFLHVLIGYLKRITKTINLFAEGFDSTAWAPDFATLLKRVKRVETLRIDFAKLYECDITEERFYKLASSLLRLEGLKFVTLNLNYKPETIFMKAKIKKALEKLKNIRLITIVIATNKGLNRMAERINIKQSLRSDFMF